MSKKALVTFSFFLTGLAAAQTTTPASFVPGNVLAAESRGGVAAAAVRPAISGLYARAGAPSARFSVERFRLKVQSTDESGRPITVSALLYVPVLPKTHSASLYVMGPGTTGIFDECAPTRENPKLDNWGDYEAHMLSYASQGFISVLPDWANFDDPGQIQPYFVANAEGRVMLDTARAALTFVRQRAKGPAFSGHTFLAGFSQGGHAAFAGADLAASYAPELRISGVLGYAPAMDVATLFRERPILGAYLARSYAARYGLDANKLFQSRWQGVVHGAGARACVSTVARHFPNDGASLYHPDFWRALSNGSLASFDPALARLVKLNSPGFARSSRDIPALVLTGLTDPIVTANAQLTFMRKSCAFGRAIVQREYPDTNHYQARQFGFTDSVKWMRDREAGVSAPTSCTSARYQTLMKGRAPAPKERIVLVSKRR